VVLTASPKVCFSKGIVTQTEVLIIGAGAAGLAAARDLSKTGLQVTVIEARARVGGRIFTHRESNTSFPIELGAEFIHGKSPEIFSIIEQAGLSVEEVTGRHWFFDTGKLTKSGDFWSSVEELMAQMKKELKDRSFEDYLSSLTNSQTSERTKAMASGYVVGFHAAETDKIGIHGLTAIDEASEQIDGDRSFRLLEGYSSLINWLQHEAQTQGAKVHLNTIVAQVRWEQNKVEVVSVEEELWSARAVLITLPLSLLKLDVREKGAVKFSPGLPTSKLEAIKVLEMGSALRVVMRFTDRFWENINLPGTDEDGLRDLGFIHYPDAPLPTWWTTNSEHEPLLVGWAGGGVAARLLSSTEDEIVIQSLKSLTLVFGLSESELRTRLVKTYLHNWQTDPQTLGAYAYLPVDGIEHQLNLAKPVEDTLFFAGEATSLGHVGTVHGAIKSGQRAAREIFTAFGGS
jgi:monoamine oxidase